MKLFLIAALLFISGCSTPGTSYTPATTFGLDGYFVKDSTESPGHGVSIFQANKNTKPTLAVVYTVLAAHEACMKKDKVSVVLPPQYFEKERRYASSYQCEDKIKIIKDLPMQLQENPDGILVLDEFTTLPFMESDLILGHRMTTLYHLANTTQSNSLKLKIKRRGKPKTIQVKLLDRTEHYLKLRQSDIEFICKMIQEEGIKPKESKYPKVCKG